jgi:formate dehydrogenase major subunit
MLTGNIGRKGVGVNPLRGQNNVQGSCDMGSFPHELPGYRHVKHPEVRAIYEKAWGVTIDPEPGLRIPNMLDAAVEGSVQGPVLPGRGHPAIRPRHPPRRGGSGGDGMRDRP